MKRVLILATLALLGLLLVLIAGVLTTERGARLVAAQVNDAAPELRIGEVRGSIATGLLLDGVIFENAAVKVTADAVEARVDLASLRLRDPLRFTRLHARNLQITVRSAPGNDNGAPSAALQLPKFEADSLSLDGARLDGVGQGPISLAQLQAAVSIGESKIEISQLVLEQLQIADIRGDASGALTLDLASALRLASASLRIDAQVLGQAPVDWRAQLDLAPRDGLVVGSIRLDAPISARIAGEVAPDLRSANLTAQAQPQSLAALGFDQIVGANLVARATDARWQIDGSVEAAGEQMDIEQLGFLLSATGLQAIDGRVVIGQRGALGVSGNYGFASAAPTALKIDIDALQLPRGDGGTLRIDGPLQISGSDGRLTIAPQLTLDTTDLPSGDLSGELELSADGAIARGLLLRIAGGEVRLDGEAGGGEAQSLKASVRALDPALFIAGWPGRVSADLEWIGGRDADGWNGALAMSELDGQLRERPLSGSARILIEANQIASGELTVGVGRARIDATAGAGLARIDATLRAPDLADVWPEAGGNLDLRWQRDGADRLDFRGEALRYGNWRAATVEGDVRLGAGPSGALEGSLRGDDLELAGQTVEALQLSAEGTRRAHRLNLRVDAAPNTLVLAAGGTWQAQGWSGELTRVELTRDGQSLRLGAPTELALAAGRLRLAPACFDGLGAQACIEAEIDGASGSVSVRGQGLSWQILAGFAGLPATAPTPTGSLDLDGEARWVDGALGQARIDLRSERGQLRFPDRPDLQLGHRDLVLALNFADGAGSLSGSANLEPEGRIDISGTLGTQAESLAYDVDVDVAIKNLDPIEALTPMVAQPEGEIGGRFKFTGALGAGQPQISGAVALTDFTALLPDYAIRVRDGVLVLAGVPGRLVMRGALTSGDGRLVLDGRIDLDAEVPAQLTITGNDFRVANTPTLSITVTPDLRLSLRDNRWRLLGSVAIPRARIDAEKLEGGVSTSPDVVVIDDPQAGDPARPWRAQVRVELGDDVQLKGFGFDGTLGGGLTVRQEQGGQATATGQITVDGTYRAYGQNLQIDEGRLRYVNSALGDPTIDVRAERTVRGETVALKVRGTLGDAVTEVVAAPGRTEQQSLQLLVSGRAGDDGGDGALGAAVAALSAAGGDALAGRLGKAFGLDEVGVSSDTAIEGEAFTVGKYLTPRLYVAYGVGLLTRGEVFTVRYLLTERIAIEASSGETQRAAINYSIER